MPQSALSPNGGLKKFNSDNAFSEKLLFLLNFMSKKIISHEANEVLEVSVPSVSSVFDFFN